MGVSHPQTVQARPPTVSTGRIYTIGQLDREQVSWYDLTVVARDTSDQPLSGSSQVTITVLDYNDNAPEFSKDTFTFEVEEESLLGDGLVGSLSVSQYTLCCRILGNISNSQAVDEDEGSNALFDFSLAVGARESEIFSLEASGSTVELRLLRALDRETDDSYSLRLQATDRGSPSLVGETIINITVLVRKPYCIYSRTPLAVHCMPATPCLLHIAISIKLECSLHGRVSGKCEH